MNALIDIIKGTPWWVYIIFIYLLIVGIKATKTRIYSLYTITIFPLVIMSWFLIQLNQRNVDRNQLPFIALLFLVGGAIGFNVFSQEPLNVNQQTKTVTLPGSISTLVLLISIFIIKYFFDYMHATNPIFIYHAVIL